jgi:hypothetical protein
VNPTGGLSFIFERFVKATCRSVNRLRNPDEKTTKDQRFGFTSEVTTEKKMTTAMQPDSALNAELCSDDNIAFLMLSEVLRARSLDILEALRDSKVNVTHVRRLALHMSLSSEDLIRSAGLLKNPSHSIAQRQNARGSKSQEPASLHSIFDLCMIAARNRLAELKLELESAQPPRDLFVGGNPWEISYALFMVLCRTARAQAHDSFLNAPNDQSNSQGKLRVELEVAEGFADICIMSTTPLDPTFAKGEFSNENCNQINHSEMNHSEWYCFRRLLEANSAIVHVQQTETQPRPLYRITLRLPTFQPGHEEPIDFFTASLLPVNS